MGEGFIVRKGGGGAKVASPTITEIDASPTSITFTITNNSSETAVIIWEIDDTTPDSNLLELAAGATSSAITISNLNGLTTYTVYAFATVAGKQQSDTVELGITTTLIIEQGLIVSYFGASNTIPSGWFLCNGSNSTPNLTDRFIVGAGVTYAVNATGGATDRVVGSHSHTYSSNTTGGHTHTLARGTLTAGATGIAAGNSAQDVITTSSNGAHNHSSTINSSGAVATDTNLPPYYGLFYIMKGPN
jgi:hypothetical protein